jgi:hypothetical protein
VSLERLPYACAVTPRRTATTRSLSCQSEFSDAACRRNNACSIELPIGRGSRTLHHACRITQRMALMVNRLVLLAATAVIGNAASAQAPANAPGGSTALCNDGTYWSGSTKRGACSGHHGLQSWYGTRASANAPATVPKTADSSSESAATPAQPAPVTNAATPKAPATVPKVQPPAGQETESSPDSAGVDAPLPGSPAAPATVPKVSAPSSTSGAPHPDG